MGWLQLSRVRWGDMLCSLPSIEWRTVGSSHFHGGTHCCSGTGGFWSGSSTGQTAWPLETFLEVSGCWLVGAAALKPVHYQPTWPFETDGQSYHDQEVWLKACRQLKHSFDSFPLAWLKVWGGLHFLAWEGCTWGHSYIEISGAPWS